MTCGCSQPRAVRQVSAQNPKSKIRVRIFGENSDTSRAEDDVLSVLANLDTSKMHDDELDGEVIKNMVIAQLFATGESPPNKHRQVEKGNRPRNESMSTSATSVTYSREAPPSAGLSAQAKRAGNSIVARAKRLFSVPGRPNENWHVYASDADNWQVFLELHPDAAERYNGMDAKAARALELRAAEDHKAILDYMDVDRNAQLFMVLRDPASTHYGNVKERQTPLNNMQLDMFQEAAQFLKRNPALLQKALENSQVEKMLGDGEFVSKAMDLLGGGSADGTSSKTAQQPANREAFEARIAEKLASMRNEADCAKQARMVERSHSNDGDDAPCAGFYEIPDANDQQANDNVSTASVFAYRPPAPLAPPLDPGVSRVFRRFWGGRTVSD